LGDPFIGPRGVAAQEVEPAMMAYMAQFRPQGETEEDERLRRRAEDYHGGRVWAICTGYAFDPPWANPEEFHRRREEVVQQEEERYRAELATIEAGIRQRDRARTEVPVWPHNVWE
jgi:hypothetical protein